MNYFKILLTAMSMLLLPTTKLSAQFQNTRVAKEKNMTMEDYNRLSVSFAAEVGKSDLALGQDETGKGVSFGYAHGKNIVNGDFPLYLEYGFDATWLHFNDTDESEDYGYYGNYKEKHEVKLNLVSVSIPLNLTYIFSLADGKYEFAPFAGLNFKFHVIGRGKDEFTKEYSNSRYDDESGTNKYNIFDEDDMGGTSAKRFQIGMNLGFNIYKGRFSFGYRFQPDFTKIYDDELPTKTKTNMVSIGIKY